MTNKTSHKIPYIDDFLAGVSQICQEISQTDIDEFINALFNAWFNKQNIFLIGNGGSASTAMHFAADLNNAAYGIEDAHQVKALSLVDNISRFSAMVNDRGWEKVYTEQLNNYFCTGDVVIAISVHGGSGKDQALAWSQNLLAALSHAKERGGKALGLSGFDGGAMRDLCDVCVVVPYNTTPHVEGFHMVLHHLISDALSKKIRLFYDSLKANNLSFSNGQIKLSALSKISK